MSKPQGHRKTLDDFYELCGSRRIWDSFSRPKWIELSDIHDGPDTTILVAEVADSKIMWTEPRDLDVRTMSFVIDDPTRPSISSDHGSPNVLFADASRMRLDATVFPNLARNGSAGSVDPELVRAMTTIQGGETLDRSELFKPLHQLQSSRGSGHPGGFVGQEVRGRVAPGDYSP